MLCSGNALFFSSLSSVRFSTLFPYSLAARTQPYMRRRDTTTFGGVSNLIEIPLCEIVEKSSHAIVGACAKMKLQEKTRFVR